MQGIDDSEHKMQADLRQGNWLENQFFSLNSEGEGEKEKGGQLSSLYS